MSGYPAAAITGLCHYCNPLLPEHSTRADDEGNAQSFQSFYSRLATNGCLTRTTWHPNFNTLCPFHVFPSTKNFSIFLGSHIPSVMVSISDNKVQYFYWSQTSLGHYGYPVCLKKWCQECQNVTSSATDHSHEHVFLRTRAQTACWIWENPVKPSIISLFNFWPFSQSR